MKTEQYTGTFKSEFSPNEYQLTVHCCGIFQAFFLLTADGIRSGRHYQLHTISSERRTVLVKDITGVKDLFTTVTK